MQGLDSSVLLEALREGSFDSGNSWYSFYPKQGFKCFVSPSHAVKVLACYNEGVSDASFSFKDAS